MAAPPAGSVGDGVREGVEEGEIGVSVGVDVAVIGGPGVGGGSNVAAGERRMACM